MGLFGGGRGVKKELFIVVRCGEERGEGVGEGVYRFAVEQLANLQFAGVPPLPAGDVIRGRDAEYFKGIGRGDEGVCGLPELADCEGNGTRRWFVQEDKFTEIGSAKGPVSCNPSPTPATHPLLLPPCTPPYLVD